MTAIPPRACFSIRSRGAGTTSPSPWPSSRRSGSRIPPAAIRIIRACGSSPIMARSSASHGVRILRRRLAVRDLMRARPSPPCRSPNSTRPWISPPVATRMRTASITPAIRCDTRSGSGTSAHSRSAMRPSPTRCRLRSSPMSTAALSSIRASVRSRFPTAVRRPFPWTRAATRS